MTCRSTLLCAAVFLHALVSTQAVTMRTGTMVAKAVAQVIGENKAASKFASDFVGALPQNLTKDKQDAVIKVLEGEVEQLSGNVDKIKDLQKTEHLHAADSEKFANSLKGKDHDMMESMNKWSSRMNEKAKVGAMGVLSKLKNAIHLIKKGALQGDPKAADNLNKVLADMAEMQR
mmetsp:Transcript_51020/g.119335  ORF Transcript_51020/g.119335 Transcript_51020/m.119335 type:complete len:175 (+) Transcript_51020:57-581(+)